MLNKERIQLLIKALRSGKYSKVENILCYPVWACRQRGLPWCGCANGVAAEVFIDNNPGVLIKDALGGYLIGELRFVMWLPETVLDWYGEDFKALSQTIQEWNDVNDFNFEEIATMLEARI